MVVAMVAAGVLDVRSAIPIVMGANIGTSVTNTLVSLGHITRRAEFERAFAAAVVHDFFNCIAVVILLPLEMLTRFLEKSATFMGTLLAGGPTLQFSSPLKAVTKPVVQGFQDLLEGIVGSGVASSLLLIAIGLVVLVAALAGIVAIMRRVMRHKIAAALNRVLGRSAMLSIMIGLICTAVVQSSSVTTSLLVPLAGAGIVRLSAIFPVTLGSNVGTTVTAMLAAMGTLGAGKEPTGLIIALCHFLFNVVGIIIVYGIPAIRRIPLRLATKMGEVCARSRHYAFVYVAVVFFLVPIALIAATNFKGILRMIGL
jgi:sodium-dependent phosphate cotransporter